MVLLYSCHGVIVSTPCSIAVCQFATKGDQEWYVVVGTAKDMVLSPRTCSGGSLIVFRLSPDGSKLEHVHSVSYNLHTLLSNVDTTGGEVGGW